MATDWVHFPVLSGLMFLTVPERRCYALRAMDDFRAQNWPHKELVVVNATGISVPVLDDVLEIPVRRVCEDMWRFGLAQCSGEWIADWQDDCRYAKNYLQTLARSRSKEAHVSLRSYRAQCIDEEKVFTELNNSSMFRLFFRFFQDTNRTTWLDRPDLVTRYYAYRVSI